MTTPEAVRRIGFMLESKPSVEHVRLDGVWFGVEELIGRLRFGRNAIVVGELTVSISSAAGDECSGTSGINLFLTKRSNSIVREKKEQSLS